MHTHTVCKSGYIRMYIHTHYRVLSRRTNTQKEIDWHSKLIGRYTIPASHYSDTAPAHSRKVCKYIIIHTYAYIIVLVFL